MVHYYTITCVVNNNTACILRIPETRMILMIKNPIFRVSTQQQNGIRTFQKHVTKIANQNFLMHATGFPADGNGSMCFYF